MAAEFKEMVCITCPLGCRLELEIEDGDVKARCIITLVNAGLNVQNRNIMIRAVWSLPRPLSNMAW